MRRFGRIAGKVMKQPGYAIGVGLKRLNAEVSYRFGNGIAPNPESITLFLTHKCNLHCKMCGQWGEGGITKKRSAEFITEELPPETARRLADETAPFAPSITLFGGEPLLHTDCVGIMRYIKAKKMHCLMITNGFLVEEHAAALVDDSGLDELNVSIDGARDLHDQIRGMPGLFEKIMAGLELVGTIKRARGAKKPLINIQCTITRYNYNRLEEMAAVAERAHADSLTFHNLIFTDNGMLERQRKFDEALGASSADWEGFVASPGIDTALLREKMERLRGEKHAFNIDFYPNFTYPELDRYYNDPEFIPSGYPARCMSPWLVAYVFPDGSVRPCLNSSYAFGNIKEGSFAAAWNSAAAVKYRRMLRENGIFPACARCTELYRY